MSERTVTQLEKWLLKKLEGLSVEGGGRPVLACQVAFVTGENVSGGLRATEVPGVYEMLIEAQRQTGERLAVDRIFPAETMLSILIPRDLPPIERTANAGGSKLWTPNG
jgi:hypothetical protein